MRFRKLSPRDLQRRAVKPGRTPAHFLFQMADYPSVEERKHDAQHAGIRIQSTHGDLTDFSGVQLAYLPSAEPVGGLFENQIVRLRDDEQVGVGRSGETAFLLQHAAKNRVDRVEELREHPAGKPPRILP